MHEHEVRMHMHTLRCAGRFYDERGALSDGWTEAEACEFERRMVEQVRVQVIGAGT
jgi:predicted metalloendopeptidase